MEYNVILSTKTPTHLITSMFTQLVDEGFGCDTYTVSEMEREKRKKSKQWKQ